MSCAGGPKRGEIIFIESVLRNKIGKLNSETGRDREFPAPTSTENSINNK